MAALNGLAGFKCCPGSKKTHDRLPIRFQLVLDEPRLLPATTRFTTTFYLFFSKHGNTEDTHALHSEIPGGFRWHKFNQEFFRDMNCLFLLDSDIFKTCRTDGFQIFGNRKGTGNTTNIQLGRLFQRDQGAPLPGQRPIY